MTQCVKSFKEFSSEPSKSKSFQDESLTEKANQIRLELVDKILCAAYVDDLSCHEFFTSLVSYFIHFILLIKSYITSKQVFHL